MSARSRYPGARGHALALLLLTLTFAATAQAAPDPGSLERFSYPTPLGTSHYLLYTPASVDRAKRAPMVVMTHGCNTTALQQAAANLYHPLAERERFLVLYPDNDSGIHPLQCWQFYSPTSWLRGAGDVADIAGMTRQAMSDRRVDPERVYAIGMSSGAFITSDLGATYPDLYAAIGVMAGGPFAGMVCIGGLRPDNLGQLAQQAFVAQGAHQRVLPFIVLHGDRDGTVTPGCGEDAAEQWLRTNNLVTSGTQGRPLSLKPASRRTRTKPGGRRYDVDSYRDPGGCLIGERWTIHGMDHFWSGGTTDPKLAEFTDPKGPSAAIASWRFFKRYRRSETGLPCAEATRTTKKQHPRSRVGPK